MEAFYLILVIVLFGLAISDLIVGVSNDAVNFLNSAIGAKAAPFKIIMIVAALGVLVGATFSSGLMEVARKGIFHPGQFYFSEIMIIFLAVMITDVILLDAFNTFGLPTSTTVSIVFELLGAAVAISLLKIYASSETLADIGTYINSSNALMIIFGILLSVAVAFTVGAIVQYIARLMFTFNYKKNLKYFGALWGGIAISAITYFMLIKGAKGASFMDDSVKAMIHDSQWLIVLVSFIFWTVLFQVLTMSFKKLDVLKIIVLVGTFALA
ncbi:MAG: inorganic phosphate transporter, partial [Bacteroidales bacterium]|nr:inorganic phosphate transporter [Bacteroidales bacterium]